METYLAHHGILGMKWGVRRYQNPDGTLTEAGKRRIAANRKMSSATGSAAKATSQSIGYRNMLRSGLKAKSDKEKIRDMSDEELKKQNARAALEQQYRKNNGLGSNSGNSQSKTAAEMALDGISDAAAAVSKKYERIADGETARKAKTMTDAELRSAVQRMQLEDQYRQLSKKDRDSGAYYVYNHNRETINDIVTFVTPVATAVVIAAINKKISG